jgi:hypothetical protein
LSERGRLRPQVHEDIAPAASLEIGKKKAGSLGEFKVGVRREIWLYLLLAVIGVSLIEWLTYHRRWTV